MGMPKIVGAVCGLGLLMAAGCAVAPEILPFDVKPVAASVETDPMTGRGDRADDPAIWVDPADPSRSLILGTDKDNGLYVYGLDGKTRQYLDVGRVNNVDVRGTLAVASNDEVNGLSWFRIDAQTREVLHLGDTKVDRTEPYGICLGMIDGRAVAGVTYKDGTVELWTALVDGDEQLSAALTRTVKLSSQLEGCVFDDSERRLFIGEENVGLWSLELADDLSEPVSVDTIAAGNGLVADVEGVSLWLDEDGAGYLIASAQAADRFVIYNRIPPHAPLGIITITGSADGSIDAVSHTDGLDVTSSPLPGYRSGLMVVQDDGTPASGVNQNFKLVDWAEIEAALGWRASAN